MAGDLVRFELPEHVAQVTIGRPERRDALNREAYAESVRSFLEKRAPVFKGR